MKKIVTLALLFLITYHGSAQTNFGTPEVDPFHIQSKFVNWLTYQNTKIMLSRDFIALNSSNKIIPKELFLNELIQGNYIPIRLQSNDSEYYYKLFKILPSSDTSIKATIVETAIEEYQHYKMERTPFPKFNFMDVNGTAYSNETIKGKIVVIKCWFIHCPSCIKEFPLVNALVDQYKNNKDVLFLSLAEDSIQELSTFLTNKPLSYSVIPKMKNYMNESLHISSFPTHFIISKEGLISKILINYESLEVALEKECQKNKN